MSSAPDIGLGSWITERTRRDGHRTALTFGDTSWTFNEFLDRIDRFAGALRARGVAAGDRVAYLGFNHSAFFVTLFASAKLGAIFVPLNFRLSGPELEFIINDAGASVLVAGREHVGVIDSVRATLCCKHYLAVDMAQAGWDDFDQALAAGTPVHAPLKVSPDDTALIMYTSGTTGRPKGAMLTHGNIWWNNINCMLFIDVSGEDVHLTCAPVFHIGGLNVLTLATWMKAGHVVLHKEFDPARVLRDITAYRITTGFAVPAMLQFISMHPDFAKADMSSLRLIAVGGAPVPEGLLKLYNSRNIPVHQGYGLTETAPMASFLMPEWSLSKLGSAGKPPLLTEIRLIDGQGAVVTAPMARGEICIKGPNIMKGYWNRPDATRDAIDEDGWFRSGDVGYLDNDGFLFICDRVKDMIITGGENVYPAEVESVLFEHPGIAEVAVVGMPDEKWGETVVAVVALKPEAKLTLEELQAFAEKKLARYKIPRHLRLVPALPRNATGKILKYQLRQQLTA